MLCTLQSCICSEGGRAQHPEPTWWCAQDPLCVQGYGMLHASTACKCRVFSSGIHVGRTGFTCYLKRAFSGGVWFSVWTELGLAGLREEMRHLLRHSACKPNRFKHGMSLFWGHCGWDRSFGWQPASFSDHCEHQLLCSLPWTSSCLHRGVSCSFLCLLPSILPWAAHGLALLRVSALLRVPSSEWVQQQHMAGMDSEMIYVWAGIGVCSQQTPAGWDQDIPGCKRRGASTVVAFSMRFSPEQKGSHWHIHFCRGCECVALC